MSRKVLPEWARVALRSLRSLKVEGFDFWVLLHGPNNRFASCSMYEMYGFVWGVRLLLWSPQRAQSFQVALQALIRFRALVQASFRLT